MIICNMLDGVAAEHVEGRSPLVGHALQGGQELSSVWRQDDRALQSSEQVFGLLVANDHCLWWDDILIGARPVAFDGLPCVPTETAPDLLEVPAPRSSP